MPNSFNEKKTEKFFSILFVHLYVPDFCRPQMKANVFGLRAATTTLFSKESHDLLAKLQTF